ncbi:MAG: C40 family peptidase [Myxococcales bacterium]|nr:C40 family peptidase [Myxococcales bacterium]
MRGRVRISMPALSLALTLACAGPQAPAAPRPPAPATSSSVAPASARANVARTAVSMIGAPYRYGGKSPSGFDCSGLVFYSYAKAGFSGLPRTASALERRARPIPLAELQPGDLLFFDLIGKKTAHVAIYVGDRTFVHAPSGGKQVEKVDFDHVYWGPRLGRAGRVEF